MRYIQCLLFTLTLFQTIFSRAQNIPEPLVLEPISSIAEFCPQAYVRGKKNFKILLSDGSIRIAKTENSGANWSFSDLDLDKSTSSFLVLDEKSNGHILASNSIANTRYLYQGKDMGEEWEDSYEISEEINPVLNSLQFFINSKSHNFHLVSSLHEGEKSQLFFQTSSNKGKKWSDEKQISNDEYVLADQAKLTSSLSSDRDGRLFMTYWANGHIYFDRSYDGGKRWLRNDIKAIDTQNNSPEIDLGAGFIQHSVPALEVDRSKNIFTGMIYVLWVDKSMDAEEGENSDLYIARSNKYGDTWTRPFVVEHEDQKKNVGFANIKVDEQTGTVYLAYYSFDEDRKADIWLAYSDDAGSKFIHKKINSESVNLPDLPKQHRIALDANNEKIVLSWAENEQNGITEWKVVMFNKEILLEK